MPQVHMGNTNWQGYSVSSGHAKPRGEAPIKVLLVDLQSDAHHAVSNFSFLRNQGFHVDLAQSLTSACSMSGKFQPNIVVIWASKASYDTIQLCQQLRQVDGNSDVGILVLSNETSEDLQVRFLSAGADSIIAVPRNVELLSIRINALCKQIKRTQRSSSSAGSVFEWNGLRADNIRCKAFLDDRVLRLTTAEFRILSLLLSSPGEVFSRKRIIEDALHVPRDKIVIRNVDVRIGAIRQQFGDKAYLIETVRGKGYRIAADS